MGMYDEISKSLTDRIVKLCPYCGGTILEDDAGWRSFWQTKSFDCILKTLDLKDIESNKFEMHICCSKCGKFISALVNLDKGIIIFKGRNNEPDKWALAEDTDLKYEFKEIDRKRHNINNSSNNWLKSKSIGYDDIIEYIYPNNMKDTAEELLENFYIIPKEYLEDFT